MARHGSSVRRFALADDQCSLAHWPEVNAALASPLLIAGTYGVADLELQRTEFVTLSNAIVLLRDTLLPTQRAQRDGAWGLTPTIPAACGSSSRATGHW